MPDLSSRIRHPDLLERIVTPEVAAAMIEGGMIVGMSGFTKSGDAKAVPRAMAERARTDPFQITLITGASLGQIDRILTEAKVLSRRMPFQADPTLRKAINRGEVMFLDQHLSETVEHLRSNQLGPVDYAIIEAAAITEDGYILPTTSIGNSASLAILARKVIVEINLSQPLGLDGLHDVYIPTKRPARQPIPVMACDSRVGTPYVQIPADKIVAVVITDEIDSSSSVVPADADTQAIANHLIAFLEGEVAAKRLDLTLQPLQAGVGSIANSVLQGLSGSPFHDLRMYSEVLQDSTFDLFDAGKLSFASASSFSLSAPYAERIYRDFARYKDKLVLRPQEISNHPEVIRRLGIIAINTALEFDIYGNVNSTHVDGTMMMNGIGGSGDFARNAYLSIFVTKSLAKDGAISSVVPMVTHVDHTEHDVDILVTECGLADLRGLAPRERALVVIDNCVHPTYRAQMRDYFDRACQRGGHTPHLLEEAFGWHMRRQQTGSMRA